MPQPHGSRLTFENVSGEACGAEVLQSRLQRQGRYCLQDFVKSTVGGQPLLSYSCNSDWDSKQGVQLHVLQARCDTILSSLCLYANMRGVYIPKRACAHMCMRMCVCQLLRMLCFLELDSLSSSFGMGGKDLRYGES